MTSPDSVAALRRYGGTDRQRLDERGAVGDPEDVAVEVGEHPLVGVERVAVAALDARLRAPRSSGQIIAEPAHAASTWCQSPCAAATAGDGGDRVDGAGARRADRARHDGRTSPGGAVLRDRRRERLRPQREASSTSSSAHVPEARPCARRARPRSAPARSRRRQGGRSPRRRAPPARRATTWTRCVESDALIWITPPPGRPPSSDVLREAEQVDEPVEHVRLDLRQRRARRPEHPLRAEAGRHELGQDRGRRGVGREVGEPARRLPVRDARQDDRVEVAQQRLERLGLLRRAPSGSRARTSPGATSGCTGSSPTRSM